MRIGTHLLANRVILAPMAGVTDRPFRQLCKAMGAGMVVSEMVSCNSLLWGSDKTQRRIDHGGEAEPRSVQIVGADPRQMADAARYNVEHGADIVDINMGCPAKKVCNVAAGSALMKNEVLVAEILSAVVNAVDVPVTLKIRTGWDAEHRNGARIARVAQDCGIQALAVHGRTRACGFAEGTVEYDTIAEIKRTVSIPVIANGDIRTPAQAKLVLDYTGADAVMIGRAAQGRPWIFREIAHYLATGEALAEPGPQVVRDVLLGHLHNLYALYGDYSGVRVARKHIAWYSKGHPQGAAFRQLINHIETPEQQLAFTREFFDQLTHNQELAA
ncbi:MAG: tRNA dihydrouridine synthase DusB [Gammaproteobacteria bacterium]|nr:tRNA dihydrouridine synthase DusB [Gammaproteobacteria bacterium]